MSKLERLRNSLKNLEESKATYHERIDYFRKELAYIDSPAQKFELKKRIELDEKEIFDIDIKIASVNEEIEKIESKLTEITEPPDKPKDGKVTPPPPKPPDKPKDGKVTPPPPKPLPLKGDYTRLCELLDNEQWKEADLETTQILLQIAKRQKEGWLKADHIKQFSCADLNMIDQLWSEASQNKFGFKAQMTIWAEIIEEETEKPWTKNFYDFSDIVGWRDNGNLVLEQKLLQFSLDAPSGHLPSLRNQTNDFETFKDNFKEFLLRLETCCM
jgi:hypothetical protein